MEPTALSALWDLARPHLLAVALSCGRLAPVTFLCPCLGGQLVPTPIRLGLCLALAVHVHFAGGVGVAPGLEQDLAAVAGSFASEVAIGGLIGYLAMLPFDAARVGGRLADVLRGANAEATLPTTGSREAATGELLHLLLCATVCAGPSFAVLLSTLEKTFVALPLGSPPPVGEAIAERVLAQVGAVFAAGLAIGAPVAAIALVVEGLSGVVTRLAPAGLAAPAAVPARLLLGAGATLLSLGAIADRLLLEFGETVVALGATLGAQRPGGFQ